MTGSTDPLVGSCDDDLDIGTLIGILGTLGIMSGFFFVASLIADYLGRI